MTTFQDLKLAAPLAKALDALGYLEPTPIQAQAIPEMLEGRDLLGIAQTGTGKTAAFALPALHKIVTDDLDPPKRGATVLVLAPTRELTGQIAESFRDYGRFIEGLSITKVTGGVPIARQIKNLVRGSDVLVATPGRLIDLLDRKAVKLSDVEVLILDEADQMMDMGFIHALKKIVPLLPSERQTCFLSATLPPKIKSLADSFLTNPVKVSVSPPNTTAERVTQSLTFATKEEKVMLLADNLLRDDVERSLVFTRTKHGADRVVKRLAMNGLPAVAIHGNKSQGQRTRALEAFKSGKVDILVATDVAARGIDIPGITHVFNYEIPNVPEQYVHRIGRTARANTDGRAIAFVAPDERPYLKDIQKLLGETIPVEPIPEDMSERIKVIKRRDKSEPVNLTPEQPARKGRGKGKKKSRYAKSNKSESRGTPFADRAPRERVERPKREEGRKPAPKREGGASFERKAPSGGAAPKPGRQPGGKESGYPKSKPSGKSTGRRPAPQAKRGARNGSQPPRRRG